jgi:RND superfamily putative drug exporter
VIAVWVALAVALPLNLPQLNDMARKHPLAMLPADAPSSVAAREMTKGFQETGTDDLLLVVLSDPRGLGPDQEGAYRKLVSALRSDSDDVVMLQDFIQTPSLRSFLTSKDGKAWVVPVGLAGALGTPQAYAAFNRVADIVHQNTGDSGLEVHLTGPASTVADLTVAGQRDRMPIEIAIGVLLLIVLLVVYRNPIAMVIPLIGIGISLVIAQSAVAGLSESTGFGVSNQAIILLSAMIAGAGTDYAVFLISRYHDYVRRGDTSDNAVRHALSSVGKVITASAATIGITFLAISFAKMGVFSTVGVSSAIGVAVAFLAALTLLPAIIAVVGRWGWIKPRRELTAGFWRRSGIRIVRRPRTHLAASLLVLTLLAGSAGLARYNYDDRKSVQPSDPSSVGYAALERHFDINQFVPSYVLIHSPRNLRTPQTLADMEQMADRISQLPNIAMVNGVTRPLGKVPKEFRATYQAGIVGDKLSDGSATIGENMEGLNRLSAGANELAGGLTDVRGQVNDLATNIEGMVEAFTALKFQYSGDNLVKNVEVAAKLVQAINELGISMGITWQAGRDLLGWVGPVLTALHGNAVCDLSPSCAETRGHFQSMVDARNSGTIDKINDLATQLKNLQKTQSISATLNQIRDSYARLAAVMKAMGLDTPVGAQSTMNGFRQQADRAAAGSQQVAAGVDQVIGQIEVMRTGLDQLNSCSR